MLGIDPGENSLSLPPPRLGTSEAGHRRAEGRAAGVDGLDKSHCDSVDPRDGEEEGIREGCLAERS